MEATTTTLKAIQSELRQRKRRKPIVTNVVLKLKIDNVVNRLKWSRVAHHLEFAEYTNFCVIRGLCHVTLIAFTKSGHVNITGVRGFRRARDVFILLSHVLEETSLIQEEKGEKSRPITVVSSTATGNIHSKVKLARLIYDYQQQTQDIRKCWYQRELSFTLQYGHFPSLLIRRPNRKGCVQLFGSGKFNIVGCDQLRDIKELWRIVSAIIRM